MKTILITAPASGSGKTTITLGLIRALKNRGMEVCAFKTGPDYIDRAFLEQASGLPAGNLDFHLQGRGGLAYSLSRAPADHCIIEGVMGFFDGISNTFENSCFDIARQLDIPSLLVYSPKGEMFTAIPKIKGMLDFPGSTINSILLNNVTPRYFELLKGALEEYTDLKILGYVPKLEKGVFESRHLGLVQSNEIDDLDAVLDHVASVVSETVDLDQLLTLMRSPRLPEIPLEPRLPESRVRIAVARDKAFSFYYRENLELLESCARVTFFSPLKDSKLPACDLVYFGGGYPEVFRQELSENKEMLSAVREYGESDGYIFAECGGLMYLAQSIEDSEMVGLFQGNCQLTKSLQRFGYIDLELKEDCFLGKKGTRFTGHEFHKSITTIEAPTVFDIQKTRGSARWSCGFRYKNVIAGYPHISFLSNMKILRHMLNWIER
jgi:cobyrinic acid a,c-diamide synthase